MLFDDRNIIELIDEDGNKEEFEVKAVFHIEENQYVILTPYQEKTENDEEEIYPLRIEYDEWENPIFVNIEDEDELQNVIDAYDAIREELL